MTTINQLMSLIFSQLYFLFLSKMYIIQTAVRSDKAIISKYGCNIFDFYKGTNF